MAKFSTKSILPKFDEKAKAQGRLAALKSRTFTIPTHRARDWIWKLVSKHWIRLNLGWSFGFQVFSGLEEEKERLEEKLAQVFSLNTLACIQFIHTIHSGINISELVGCLWISVRCRPLRDDLRRFARWWVSITMRLWGSDQDMIVARILRSNEPYVMRLMF